MRLALLAMALGAFGIGTTEFVIMGLLPEVSADLDVSVSSAGNLIAGYAIGVVIGAPLLTVVSTRLPRRRALILFMGVFAAGNLLSALAPEFGAVLGFRVLTGLPHGAYFGAAAVAAAQLAEPGRRARNVARVFLGLTVANIVGVPAGTWLGQELGWRATFGVVAAIGVVAMAGIALCVPHLPKPHGVRLRHEMAGLANRQVVLGLLTIVLGCSGVFAVYTYIAPTMKELAGFTEAGVTGVLALFGVGMTLGSLLGGRMADRALRPSVYGSLTSLALVLLLFSFAVHNPWTAAIGVVALGVATFATCTVIQVFLMTKAERAPTLTSASNHAAFNLANAFGAWIGGAVIGAGLGYTAPALVGAAMAVVGVGLALAAGYLDRPRPPRSAPAVPDAPTEAPAVPAGSGAGSAG
ncbi:MFS transporter [Streptomonospora salina]|uniref:DHA1 family inner membrane transport protein n=1 Tax=Streptomonospora salina TaxID=104205 RepID=A0A841E7D8_9ACTN|nr:MFS transporter [Streptomonospora salina]MBB5997033.1 DHA1 family inner membrane transport protein [Streptomonospora salina]